MRATLRQCIPVGRMCISRFKNLAPLVLLACAQGLSGCLGPSTALAPSIAEPNARPTRNFTSFTASLACMDGLLKAAGGGTTLVSSNGFPDRTKDLDIGADDMLINAISRMNASNQRYVFLDQALIKDPGQMELVTSRPKKEQQPNIYIRGSISQLDSGTVQAEYSNKLDGPTTKKITDLVLEQGRNLSIISVDMHLVHFPSRRILPGGSVANSIVVSQRRADGKIVGLINNVSLGIPIFVEKIESNGQAVRNLIELGVIELLGRHAGVPYWTCLETPQTNASRNEAQEKQVFEQPQKEKILEAQTMLISLGLLSGRPHGKLDGRTRRALSTFQGKNGLLPNGIADFDTLVALRKGAAELNKARAKSVVKTVPKATRPKVTPPPQKAQQKTRCTKETPCDDGYLNLYEYVKDR